MYGEISSITSMFRKKEKEKTILGILGEDVVDDGQWGRRAEWSGEYRMLLLIVLFSSADIISPQMHSSKNWRALKCLI